MQTQDRKVGLQYLISSLVVVTMTFYACQDKQDVRYINYNASVSLPQLPFDIGHAVFMNQYFEPAKRTTSWILADSSIQNTPLADFLDEGRVGRLCILHWSQLNDPVWVGARIPGQFLGADLLMYDENELVIRQYKPNGEGAVASKSYQKEIIDLLKGMGRVSYH